VRLTEDKQVEETYRHILCLSERARKIFYTFRVYVSDREILGRGERDRGEGKIKSETFTLSVIESWRERERCV
jgi:hypothetical protein